MESVTDGNTAVAESTGPTTFAEAFAADASSASEPSSQSPTPADAEVPPTAQESTPATEDRSPYVDRKRFDGVNERMKAAEDWKTRYAFLDGHDPGLVQQLLQQAQTFVPIAQMYQNDKAAFLRQLANDDPNLIAEMARVLASRRNQAPAEPQLVPVALEDGTVVQMPRNPQEWLAFHQQQWMQQVEQKMAPALTAAQKAQEAELTAQSEKAATDFVDGEMGKLPGFKENLDEIGKAVLAAVQQLPPNDPRLQNAEFLKALTYRAYTQVAVPRISQASQSQTLDHLQRKAAASTAPNPGSAVPTTARDIKSFNDPRLQW